VLPLSAGARSSPGYSGPAAPTCAPLQPAARLEPVRSNSGGGVGNGEAALAPGSSSSCNLHAGSGTMAAAGGGMTPGTGTGGIPAAISGHMLHMLDRFTSGVAAVAGGVADLGHGIVTAGGLGGGGGGEQHEALCGSGQPTSSCDNNINNNHAHLVGNSRSIYSDNVNGSGGGPIVGASGGSPATSWPEVVRAKLAQLSPLTLASLGVGAPAADHSVVWGQEQPDASPPATATTLHSWDTHAHGGEGCSPNAVKAADGAAVAVPGWLVGGVKSVSAAAPGGLCGKGGGNWGGGSKLFVCQAAYGFLGDVMKRSERMRWMGPSRCVCCLCGKVIQCGVVQNGLWHHDVGFGSGCMQTGSICLPACLLVCQ
jgi:hypothetical protein